MSDKATIATFLSCHRLALVGVSRDRKDFSRQLMRDLLARGYDVVPINPLAAQVEGRTCYPSVKDVPAPPEAALLLTPAARTEAATADCLAAGVRRLWFHQGIGPGAASPAAVALCAATGAQAITDQCLYMHLPGAGLPHGVHGFFRRLLHRPRAV